MHDVQASVPFCSTRRLSLVLGFGQSVVMPTEATLGCQIRYQDLAVV